MKVKGSSYFLMVIMLVALFVIGWSVTTEHPQARLLPLLISSSLIILAIIGLGNEMVAEKRQPTTGSGEAAGEEVRPYLLNGGWVAGFVLGIYLLGFMVALPLFTLFYVRWLGARWLTAMVSAVVFTAVIYGLFELALKITLYRGWLLTSLGY